MLLINHKSLSVDTGVIMRTNRNWVILVMKVAVVATENSRYVYMCCDQKVKLPNGKSLRCNSFPVHINNDMSGSPFAVPCSDSHFT